MKNRKKKEKKSLFLFICNYKKKKKALPYSLKRESLKPFFR